MNVMRVDVVPIVGALVLALVLVGCPATTPVKDAPVAAEDLVGRWSAQYANDDGDGVTVTYDLYDDRTFRRVTTVTHAAASMARHAGHDDDVLSETVVTGTWNLKPGEAGGGAVTLKITGCIGDDCGTVVTVGDTFDLTVMAADDETIHLAVAPGATATSEPLPAMDPARGLIGTYRAQIDVEEGGDLETVTLTFTASRWIWHATDVGYQQSGGWSISGSTLTKTWYDGETQSIQSVAKQFTFDGADLVVDPWDWGDPAPMTVDRERYTRVENPLPASMIGSWAGPRYENLEGTWTFTETWRFILRADDTVTMEVVSEPEFASRPSPGADPYPPQCFHGTLTLDQSELFITFTNTTSNVRERRAVNVEVFDNKTWRNAYAPTDRQDVIVMSTWWSEQLWPGHALPVQEQIAAVWKDNPRFPYGDYWLTLTREPSSNREPCKW